MELEERYRIGLTTFEKALNGLELGLTIDFSQYSMVDADYIRNGWIKKFEYCTELAWKLVKVLLEWKNGQVVNSPKSVYRAFNINQYTSESLTISLLDTINDRNQLIHLYKEDIFGQILENIPTHIYTLESLLNILKQQ